jgi:hypothetical protein
MEWLPTLIYPHQEGLFYNTPQTRTGMAGTPLQSHPPSDVPIATTHEAVAHIWHHNPAVNSVAPVQTKCKKYSDILQQQRLTINQLAANQSVNIGQLWTFTNYPLHRHTTIDFKTCRGRFFQYRVFNWRPDLLLEHDWIPNAPTAIHGVVLRSRRVWSRHGSFTAKRKIIS